MHVTQAPAKAVQITGSPDAIELALHRGLVPDARFHAAHGLTWLEVGEISQYAEAEMIGGGCKVHHR
ncbi:MAG TPA: hypothetical protein VF481_10165 [Novosphingobium sp.]